MKSPLCPTCSHELSEDHYKQIQEKAKEILNSVDPERAKQIDEVLRKQKEGTIKITADNFFDVLIAEIKRKGLAECESCKAKKQSESREMKLAEELFSLLAQRNKKELRKLVLRMAKEDSFFEEMLKDKYV